MSVSNTQFQCLVPQNGPLPIPMTNDYLFRALLQQNNNVLKGLISSLLHLHDTEISSVAITNPIELGRSTDEKTFILDISIVLNDSALINLEMQVINFHDWTDRSLSYLCRKFDHLKKGEPYRNLKPVIQISLLNFTLFPEHPEFYATYKLLNVKSHMLYSDKLQLSVLDLTRIDLATTEDREFHIDYWASLFNASTWEELYMLAKNNKYIKEASETIYQLTQDEQIREQCEAREDYYRRMQGMDDMLAEKDAALAEKLAALAEKDNALAEKSAALVEKDTALAEKNAALAEKDDTINEQAALIADLKAQLARYQGNKG